MNASRQKTPLFTVFRIGVFLLLMLLLIPLPALGAAEESRVLLVRGDQNYPPYEYIDENGQPAGWNIDLIKAVAEAEGLNISIRLGPWDEVRYGLETGQVDILAGMYYSPERARMVNFSSPHMVVSHAIFTRKGSAIRSPDDLKGKTILVQRGDIMHDFIRNLGVAEKIVPVENQEDALILLSKGQYDCALVAKLQGIAVIDRLGLTNIEPVGPPIEPRDYCFAVSPANAHLLPAINEGLAIVKTSGKYQDLYRKWFGFHEERIEYQRILTLLIVSLVPVALILLLVLLWSWSLRRQVTKKTVELNEELAQRKRAEQELRESEERNVAIVDAIPDLLFILTREGKYLDYHVPDESVLAIPASEIIGSSIRDAGFDEETVRVILQAIGRALDSGNLEVFRYSLQVPSGLRSYEARLKKLDHDRVLGIVRDITESRRSEEALREQEEFLATIVENIPDMLFVKDAQDLRFVRFNRAGEELLGYSRQEMYGKNDHDLFPKEEADFFTAKDREVFHERKLVEVPEEAIMTRYHGERILHTKKIPIFDANNNPLYLLGISSDITERKRAEEALTRATRKLSLLNAVTFTDIQNAVFSLAGYLGLEKRLPADEKTREYRRKEEGLVKEISAALQYVKNYQDLGKKPPSWQDVAHVFLLGISHTDSTRLDRNIQFDNLEIYADPLLENVFLALAENVIQHGTMATEIVLRYHNSTEGLTLVFEDNGSGIPDDLKEQIFERRFDGGKGGSLFLVREILSITGITIHETGIAGRGARFEMLVPKGSYRFRAGTT